MSERTGIAWTDHTFNPWWGCTKVSPGCDHCYAERDAKRFSPSVQLWDAGSERRTFGDKHWNEPRKWNRKAEIVQRGWEAGIGIAAHDEAGLIAAGFIKPTRPRVFCASMADVFDNHETAERERPRLWQLIRETPYLDWQILTKRIGNAKRMLPDDWGNGYPNVWLGASVVNQEEANRDIPKLLQTPARVRFLSCEPLLEPITFRWAAWVDYYAMNRLHGRSHHLDGFRGIGWIIVGGESGSRARPFDIRWARDIIAQCKAAGVACFVKQLGARPYCDPTPPNAAHAAGSKFSSLSDRAGADPLEWPPDLRVREFPAHP